MKPGEMEYGLPVTERYLVIIGGKGWTPAAIIEEIQNGTEYGVKFLNLFSKMPEDEWDLQFPPGDY